MPTGNNLYSAPLITVAMPVYNAGPNLVPALLSVLIQTYSNWELLLIDDGSTDGALEKARAILADPRIKVMMDGENHGLTARLNQAIDLATGQFLARMDQDDVCYPERFARQIEWLLGDPTLDLVAVRALAISPDGRAVGYFPFSLNHEEITAKPWNGFYFPHPTWMGRIEWFQRHKYTTRLCEDQGLLLRSYTSSRFATVPEILFAYRLRSQFSWRSAMQTRWACLKQQLQLFFMQRAPIMFALAILALVAKAGRDFFVASFYRQSPRMRGHASAISDCDMVRWTTVRQSLGILEKQLDE